MAVTAPRGTETEGSAVELIRDVMIPTRDGTRLAADLYRPAAPGPYPAILSFYPYLKDAWGGASFAPYYRHFASRGYAVLQADFRGTGRSEGVNPHPMDLSEREDGHDIVEWLAAQEWCTGSVGVWGISYGGITALSIASTHPPHLRAIIPVDATFDNYEWLFKTHGCRGLLLGDVDWGTRMAAMNLLPPVREDGRGHRELWQARLEANRPWFLDWHGEPPDEGFWTARRIPYGSITVPTFGICGWYDAYTEPTLEVFRAVQGPRRVLVGPWKHALPDVSPLVPTGGVEEMDRWWDRWLKDDENGVEDDPPITIYVMGEERWRHETEWPPARSEPRRLYPGGAGVLGGAPDAVPEDDAYAYDARVGIGSIGYNGHRTELPIPLDQSGDDHRSLAYTGSPLAEPLELTGAPRASLLVSADVEECMVVAKLCVVAPNGASRVISQGNVNPARADAHAPLEPLAAGERRRVEIPMHPTSTRLEPGERLRLCIAGAYFPELWPTPEPYTLTLHRGGEHASFVEIPVVPARDEPLPRPRLGPPLIDLNPAASSLTSVREDVVHEHLGARVLAFETRRRTADQIDDQTTLVGTHHALVSTDADRPWATALRVESSFELVRRLGTVSVRVESLLDWFAVQARARVTLDGQAVLERTWRKELRPAPRILEQAPGDAWPEP